MFGNVKGLVPVSQIPPLEGGKDLQSTYFVGQVLYTRHKFFKFIFVQVNCTIN